jgi:hypothetical protein
VAASLTEMSVYFAIANDLIDFLSELKISWFQDISLQKGVLILKDVRVCG